MRCRDIMLSTCPSVCACVRAYTCACWRHSLWIFLRSKVWYVTVKCIIPFMWHWIFLILSICVLLQYVLLSLYVFFANWVSCFCVCWLPKNLFVTSVKFLLIYVNGSSIKDVHTLGMGYVKCGQWTATNCAILNNYCDVLLPSKQAKVTNFTAL